jgi:hypothetical protein
MIKRVVERYELELYNYDKDSRREIRTGTIYCDKDSRREIRTGNKDSRREHELEIRTVVESTNWK